MGEDQKNSQTPKLPVILLIVNRFGSCSARVWVPCALLLGPLAAIDAKALAGGSKFAVAAENEATARAALQILEQGGTAVDAAIAGSAMLGVTSPVSCGLGGGGFALVYDATEKRTSVLDYRGDRSPEIRSDDAPLESAGSPDRRARRNRGACRASPAVGKEIAG